VGQLVPGAEGAGQVHGHVVPVTSEVDRDVDLAERGQHGALVPELVPDLVVHGHGPPQVIPWVRLVRRLHDEFEHALGRFAVDAADLAVHPWLAEHAPGGVRGVTAPQRIGLGRGDPDHRQPWGDEAGAEETVVVCGLVQVRRDLEGEDRGQVRWPFGGRADLGDGEIADPDHADLAVGPGLPRGPLHQVVEVPAFLLVEQGELATGPAGATQIGDHVDVTPGNEELAVSRFDDAGRRTQVLDLTRIRRGRDQDRKRALAGWAVNVGQQPPAVA
jgi:hypothetical protein